MGLQHSHGPVSLSFNALILAWKVLISIFLSVAAQEADHMIRISEAVTKTVVCALKSTPSDDNINDWLNPTEVANSH